MNERLENQGRLQDMRLQSKQLNLSIMGLIHTLRAEINPFKEIGDMDEALIHEQAFELAQKIDRYKGLEGKIQALKKALGV